MLANLKNKIIFIINKILYNFYKLVISSSGVTSSNSLVITDSTDVIWICLILKIIQGIVNI